ncbi:MAG: hypothetical protein CM15mP62_19310 [Rhodospirillaceae bacterium]|nr:MAG: hypothetical protein CM15mP62_19310 [Rhodospirillaceae bacterium]
MAVTLKSGLSEEVKAEENDKVQSMVETALADIEKRGDDAVRAMSKVFPTNGTKRVPSV